MRDSHPHDVDPLAPDPASDSRFERSEDHPLSSWEGDPEDLGAYVDDLSNAPELCERIFASEHEAFAAWLGLGSKPDRTRSPSPVQGAEPPLVEAARPDAPPALQVSVRAF